MSATHEWEVDGGEGLEWSPMTLHVTTTRVFPTIEGVDAYAAAVETEVERRWRAFCVADECIGMRALLRQVVAGLREGCMRFDIDTNSQDVLDAAPEILNRPGLRVGDKAADVVVSRAHESPAGMRVRISLVAKMWD